MLLLQKLTFQEGKHIELLVSAPTAKVNTIQEGKHELRGPTRFSFHEQEGTPHLAGFHHGANM